MYFFIKTYLYANSRHIHLETERFPKDFDVDFFQWQLLHSAPSKLHFVAFLHQTIKMYFLINHFGKFIVAH